MGERYTVNFECLACGSIVCLHSEIDLLPQLSYLSSNRCPGCNAFGYIWRLKDIEKEDGEESDPGKEMADATATYLN